MFKRLNRYFIELLESRDVLFHLVRQQLILKYRRTVFGYLWSLANPLLMMSVTAVVFSTLFRMDLKTYAIFLFAGMIPWNCFSSIVTQSSASFLTNEGLIKKIYLTKLIFPLAVSSGLLIDSVLAFLALFLIMVLIGSPLSWAIFSLPFAYLLLFVFSLGMALIASMITVFFRDLQYVITILMQAWFFLTPVMYKNELLAGKVAWLVSYNPVVPFIELFRAPLNHEALPQMSVVADASILAFCSLFVGLIVFASQEKKIVYRL